MQNRDPARTQGDARPAVVGGLTAFAVAVVVSVLLVVPAINSPARPLSPPMRATPLPTVLALGAPTERYLSGEYWYNFSVVAAGDNLTWGFLAPEVQSVTGQALTPGPPWAITILDIAGVPVGSYSFNVGAWATGPGVEVTAGQVLALGSSSTSLSGDLLVVSGTGPFEGSISASMP